MSDKRKPKLIYILLHQLKNKNKKDNEEDILFEDILSGKDDFDTIEYLKQPNVKSKRKLDYYWIPQENMNNLIDEIIELNFLDADTIYEIEGYFVHDYPFIEDMKFVECPLKKIKKLLNRVKEERNERNILNFKIYFTWLVHELDIFDLSNYDGLETEGKAWSTYKKLKIASDGQWKPFKQIIVEE